MKGDWLVAMPQGLDARKAMIITSRSPHACAMALKMLQACTGDMPDARQLVALAAPLALLSKVGTNSLRFRFKVPMNI